MGSHCWKDLILGAFSLLQPWERSGVLSPAEGPYGQACYQTAHQWNWKGTPQCQMSLQWSRHLTWLTSWLQSHEASWARSNQIISHFPELRGKTNCDSLSSPVTLQWMTFLSFAMNQDKSKYQCQWHSTEEVTWKVQEIPIKIQPKIVKVISIYQRNQMYF